MNRTWIDVVVARKWQETVEVTALELVAADGLRLPRFEPGAHIDVQLPDGGMRSYSLSNASSEHHRYVIGVLRDRHSRGGSAFLCEQVQPGWRLRVSEPRNEFALARNSTHSVLVAGGIGIAPLRSMAEDLWCRGAPFEVHYSARNAARAAFADDLRRRPFASRVRFHWTEQFGRLDFSSLLKPLPWSSDLYVCGPASFIHAVARARLLHSALQHRLHFEAFGV